MSEVTMYPKLERREWIFTPAPDPRDARIAALEAALDRIVLLCVESRKAGPYQLRGYMATIERLADGALMPSPEGDMTITVEELDA